MKVETKMHTNKCIPVILHDCWLGPECEKEIHRSPLGWDIIYCKLRELNKVKCSDDCPLKQV